MLRATGLLGALPAQGLPMMTMNVPVAGLVPASVEENVEFTQDH